MRGLRLAAWLGCCALALGTGGCASVKQLFFAEPTAAVDAASPSAKPSIAVYRLEIEAPGELRTLLQTYLDLSRFQKVPEGEDITSAEIDRLIAAAPAQARALLETEGYFNPAVSVTRVGGGTGSAVAPAAAAPASDAASSSPRAAPATLPLLRVRVKPGPRAEIDHFAFTAEGPLRQAADAGALDAKVLIAQVRNGWRLPPGVPFQQSEWTGAKNNALAKLRADGYPAATLSRSSALVDAQTNTVKLDVTADSGVLYKLGPLRINGLQRYGENSVQKLSLLTPGAPYRESQLIDFQERLQKSGLFEGASVALDTDPTTAEAAPVNVQLRELPLQQATFGTGYSANTGPRVTVEHLHRQPFGWEWIAKNKLELGPKLRSWSGELTSYPLEGLYRNLIAGSAEQLKTVDEVRNSWSARIGRTQDTTQIERLYYIEATHSRLDTTSNTGTTTVSNDAYTGNYHWVYRDVDSVLLPTDGYTLSAEVAGGYAVSGTGAESSGPFGRVYGRYTLYRPLGGAWFATGRIEGGEVLASGKVGIPDTLLFRAGGDDSVRGYAYRSLGPKVGGALLSGRVLLTGSAEVAHPISTRFPTLWGAAFIDAGNAADHWKNLNPVLGYGVGLRWRSPVGPLRMDLAYGDDVHKLRLHLSVGIAF
ncbi:MAG: outer membrane protein assembly factor [Burkholderiales bacterium PBB1]|nr:MAG: outer membrane protein assembly factor [Burkholderiales bacterium PBB1]